MKRTACAVLVVLAFASMARGATGVLPFIEDNYAAAVAKAKTENLPLVIEVWAPWCHTCNSMRAYVFTDKTLQPYASRFVWLSINSENASNATFLTKYPIPALPMLMVVDAGKGSLVLRYAGGSTAVQLAKLLDAGERAARHNGVTTADALLESADRLAASGRNEQATARYEQAIAKAPKTWMHLGRAAESYLFTLQVADLNAKCAAAAEQLYPRVKGTPSVANVVASGLFCAAALDEKTANRKELIATLERATREVRDEPELELTADDRSGLYQALIEARRAVGDTEAAAALQQDWASFLERAAATAATPAQRAVFDSHRLEAYLALGVPEKAVPMLLESQRDFPGDYNPPARLALAYRAMKQYDDALAASDRAMAMAYGPRKLGIFGTRADIYAAKGDMQASLTTLREAIAYAKALPKGQRNENTIAALEKRLAHAS